MTKGQTKDRPVRLATLVHALDSTIQTRSIYPPRHPMLAESVKNTKAALETWFRSEGKLELGFSPKNLLLDGQFIKDENPCFAAVATYFHARGLLALSMTRSVSESEITTLFEALRGTPEAIAEAGGVAGKVRSCAHITIKEIDYSTVLASSRRTAVSDPIRLWESLCRMGDLTKLTADTLMSTIKDSGKVVGALNTAYTRAGKDRDGVTAKIRQMLGSIGRESAKLSHSHDQPLRQSLVSIATKLNPELVASLFDNGVGDSETSALQEMLLDDLPEGAVADLVVSVMERKGKIDRNLIDLFGKLSAKPRRSTAVSSLVADKLRQSSPFKGGDVAEIRDAIHEALNIAPRDDFMTKVYKLMVDTVSEKVSHVANLSPTLKALVRDYEARVESANVDREKAELLLNVLWFESDPLQFKKFSDMLLESLQTCPKDRINALARDALKLYSEKIGADPSQQGFARESEAALGQVGKLVGVPFLVSLIPQASERELRGIGCALDGLETNSVDAFLQAFLKERSIAGKERLAIMLSAMAVTGKQMKHLVSALRKERDAKGRDILLGVFLGTGDGTRTDGLFAELGKGLFVSKHLRAAVRVCGERRVAGAVRHLTNILAVRPRLDWRGWGSLRTSAALSLLQIGSPEARQTLEIYEGKADRAVLEACAKVLGTAVAK